MTSDGVGELLITLTASVVNNKVSTPPEDLL
jgi:hypothetical protein